MISSKNKSVFIAEISANHNGKIKIAKKLILDAKKFGADYVKLQTYNANTMTLDSNNKKFKISSGLWKNYNFFKLYKKAETPFSWQKELFAFSKKNKIKCFSTPFDFSAVKLLEDLGCQMYKVASFEISDLPLIKEIASTKKPVIISTGTANLKEIDEAFNTADKYGAKEIILLYCVTNYPSNFDDFNLNNIKILKSKFNCRVGLSDHSKGCEIAKLATIAGAEIFEKHIAIKNIIGPDYKFSLKGKEIKEYREALNNSRKLVLKNFFFRNKSEEFYKKFRRSIFAVQNIDKGETFTRENLRSLRPKIGIEPKFLFKLIGKKSKVRIRKHQPISNKILRKLI